MGRFEISEWNNTFTGGAEESRISLFEIKHFFKNLLVFVFANLDNTSTLGVCSALLSSSANGLVGLGRVVRTHTGEESALIRPLLGLIPGTPPFNS